MKIPITKTVLDSKDREAVLRPLDTGWLVQGPWVKEFESRFSQFTGASFSSACSSCTSALHLGLTALGIGEGDQVVVPSFTYVASQNAVEYTGAKVIFCDIRLQDFNLDTTKLEEILEKDTQNRIKAVMPVNLFGLCSNLPAILDLRRKYEFRILEDSACGFDSWIGDRHSGTFGDLGCFSFHPRKAITTGEGGMLITEDSSLIEKVNQLRSHGAAVSDLDRHQSRQGSLLPEFELRGFNYRMTDIQASLGVTQLEKAQKILHGRRKIARNYDAALGSHPHLKTPVTPQEYVHSYQSYVCLYTGGEDFAELNLSKIEKLNRLRNQFMFRLAHKGIATRQGTHAVHTLKYYRQKYGINPEDYLQSLAADQLSIALPVYPQMTDSEFNYVMEELFQCAE